MNDPQLETDEFTWSSMLDLVRNELRLTAYDINRNSASRGICQFKLMDAKTVEEWDSIVEAAREEIRKELRSYNVQ